MSATKVPPEKSVNLVDLGFMDARAKAIDIAAFLDRLDRAGQTGDFRVAALRSALGELGSAGPGRAARILDILSDPTEAPVAAAATQGAIGAYDGKETAR